MTDLQKKCQHIFIEVGQTDNIILEECFKCEYLRRKDKNASKNQKR